MKWVLVAGGLLFAGPALADDACESLKLQQALALEPQIDCPRASERRARADSPKPSPTWFVINHDTDRCAAAASISPYPSPEAAHAAFVAAGQADVLKVYRSRTGEVESVAQEITGVGGIMWFTDLPTCDRVRELAKEHPERPGNYGN
ncbi:MAG: hypothetical protein ABSC06_20480 [Rhodopila sp.]|jgi:hypothetical protein